MTPPQLAADAPVVDVAHPLEIGACPVLRHEARATLLHRRDGRRGQRRDLHVPLVGEVGLEHRTAAITARHDQAVFLGALEQARGLKFRDHALARLEAIQARESAPVPHR